MKRLSIFILLFGLSILGRAQNGLTKQQIKEKADSILAEGNLLFQFEKAAWISIDLAMEKKDIKNKISGYLVYQKNDTIKTVILNKDNQCVYELSFSNELRQPIKEVLSQRELNDNENKLLVIKNKILKQIAEKKYEVGCPSGFSLNIQLIPFASGYKLYILTGTSQSQVIPFGNDYLFWTDSNGEILSMKKFHSRLIPTMTKGPNGEKVTESVHSHLKTEPFISATDICTFKLYSSLYGQKEFKVYSPELSIYFTYSASDNNIKIGKK
jgi:hypothetical protein